MNHRDLKRTAILAGLVAAMGAATTVHAAGSDWILQMGLDAGGDTLVTTTFTNNTAEDLNAGEMFHFDGGLIFPTLPTKAPALDTQLTIGYKVAQTSAKNGDVTFSRYPVDVIEFYNVNNWRLGAGFTYHISPTLKGSGYASGLDERFSNALGTLLEVDYRFSGNAYLGARATFIDYTVGSIKVSGDSIGLVLGARI